MFGSSRAICTNLESVRLASVDETAVADAIAVDVVVVTSGSVVVLGVGTTAGTVVPTPSLVVVSIAVSHEASVNTAMHKVVFHIGCYPVSTTTPKYASALRIGVK